MRHLRSTRMGEGGREWASWTQASLITVGSSLRSAGSTIVTGIKAGYDHITADQSEKEKIFSVSFGYVELLQGSEELRCRVLMLVYEFGFQLWSVEDNTVREIASRREEPVRCLECLPLPMKSEHRHCRLLSDWPLIAMVVDAGHGLSQNASEEDNVFIACRIKLYSLQRHSFVHSIGVPGYVLKIACSPRVLLVAMNSQIMAYDICTFEIKFSTVTYPAPSRQLGQSGNDELQSLAVPLALGPRWLAHASNQAVQTASGIAVSHNLSGTPGMSPKGNLGAVQHYAGQAAKSGGKHLKTLGEASYKYLTTQVDSWRSSVSSAPNSPSISSPQREDVDVVGTVMVRDVVTRRTVAHFRAHTSPLSLLQFDPSGTLLVTASVHGHTINIFHMHANGEKEDSGGRAVHLYQLSRGMTPAQIQAVSFSSDGHWLCASSARGTTHVFHLSSSKKEPDLPPHLVAMGAPSEDKEGLRLVKMGAVGRARSTSLLNGSIPGTSVAKAAVGMYNGSPGGFLVASAFSSRLENSDAVLQPVPWEDLWVASNDGQLFRHRLVKSAPLANGTENYHTESDSPARANGAEQSSKELSVEAVERFDICRRRTWPEREEQIFENLESSESNKNLAGRASWASYAETSVSGGSHVPLWADSQFHILEMQTSTEDNHHSSKPSMTNGLSSSFRVEHVPTRRINLQDKEGVAPVKIEGAETAVLRGIQSKSSPQPLRSSSSRSSR